jgi:hypothetical protein
MSVCRVAVASLVLLLLALFAFGCHAPPRIRATPARGAVFEYRTYSSGEDRAKLPPGFEPSHVEPAVRTRVQAILGAELAQRGYAVDDTNPDLEIVVASGHRPNRFRSGGGLEYDTTLLSDQTLVIEVWDVAAGDIVWEGTVDGYFDHARGLDAERLDADVRQLVAGFPAAASPRAVAQSPCRDVGRLTVHPCR